MTLFRRSVAICQTYQSKWLLSRGLEGIAATCCAMGEHRQAAVMLSAAETLRGAMESNVPRQYQEMYDLTVQSVLDQLSAKEF